MLRLTLCPCKPPSLSRLERPGWLRYLFPDRKLYACGKCRSKLFVPRQSASQQYWNRE